MTTIQLFKGKAVFIPNTNIITEAVINYNRLGRRRVEISVGVAYEEDIGKAIKTILNLLKKDERILDNPEPNVLVETLADSSVNLNVRFWIKVPKENFVEVKSDITKAIKDEFDKLDIEIPYPRRVVISREE